MPKYIRGAVSGSIRKGNVAQKKTAVYQSGKMGMMKSSAKGTGLKKDTYRRPMNSAASHTPESERGN